MKGRRAIAEPGRSMQKLPFLRPGSAGDVIAWRGGRGITRREFRADVGDLVERLPEQRYVLNHCQDRYLFLVGLAAALYRGQVSLFPSSRSPQVLEQLTADYPGVYCMTDQAADESRFMEVFAFAARGRAGAEVAEASLAFPAEQTAVIAFTSGSTGQPKRYPKRWGAFVHEARVAGRRLGIDPARGGYILATVPAQHMYGFVYSVILPAQSGYVLGAERPFYPEDIRAALEAYPHPAILVTTPVHVRACVLEQARLPQLDFILSSTAPLDRSLALQAEALFHTEVREFYGSTETGAIASRRQVDGEVWRTFDDIEVTLAADGFRVMAPYLPEPMILTDHVEVRNAREFVLFGRNTDLVKIGGKRISLADLNRNLLEIDGVLDGTFFLPDAAGAREPRLTAFVVAPGRTRADIVAALRTRIDPVFLPRPLRLVAALPRNATGKLPRGNLADLLRAEEAKELAG